MTANRFVLTDIRVAWDHIKDAVSALKTQYNLDWRPEDVYAQCLMGLAFCYVCPDGFVIVKPQENPFTLAKELFVWICVSRAGDGLTDYYPDICDLAKDIYATTIIFESPRDGFRRLAQRNNWAAMTEYRLPVV